MQEKMDFANLSLMDALDIAITMEEGAHERYLELARQIGSSTDDDAGSFFKTMALNEEKHAKELLQNRIKLFGTIPSTLTHNMIEEVQNIESPAYDKIKSFMSFLDALTLALSYEIQAQQFYQKALKVVKNKDVQQLFKELEEEEMHHQILIKNLFNQTSGNLAPEVSNDDIDEPLGL